MKFDSPENPIEMIEFIINSLIDFSNKNEYDYKLYNSFAKKKGKSFNRYFSEIDNETDKEKIISDLKTNFHFSIRDIVTDLMAKKNTIGDNFEEGVTYYIAQPIPDNRIRSYENNYKELIELFLDKVQFATVPLTVPAPENIQIETTPPTVTAPENKNPFPLIFTGSDDKAYNVFMDFKKIVTDYYPDYSFIFQKMKGKTEMLIEKRCRHKEFMEWLFENKYISETVYLDFIDKESFSTKYDRGMRPTQYNIIKEKYFPNNSDLSE